MSVRRGRSPRGALVALVVALSTPLGAAWATPAEAATADTATAGSTTAADPAPPTERAPLTPEQGAKTSVQLATMGEDCPNGGFFHLGKPLGW